jgi:hypothetical protein
VRTTELFSSVEEQLSRELFCLRQCTQFLNESNGEPLLKNFPSNSDWFRQVKVRHHKKESPIIESFNDAFEEKFGIQKIHQRAIFTNGPKSFNIQEGCEAFYVFPINSFNFIYNPEVTSANHRYQTTFEGLQETLAEEIVKELITELLDYSYISKNLYEGIDQGAEIVFFGIPYYYTVRQEMFPEYQELYNMLK